MADIAFVSDGSTEYSLRDITARKMIEDLAEKSSYIGVTTTPLSEGATTRNIVIDGELVEVEKGNIAVYGNAQFLWMGTKWTKFGDLSSLGKLAYKDSVTTKYTPEGTVANTDIDYTPSGTVTVDAGTDTDPKPTSVTANKVTFEYDPYTEDLAITVGSDVTAIPSDAEFKFEGTQETLQTTSTFTGTEADITISGE